ncbi:phage adaptor protein [Paenibacillus sp. Leaf72]|uniref:phage adaptor protein n=1 Tax=Paenibacillus sp. Leaf72 TaxID=1736234 RepID=UPI0006F4BAC7|nr:hypothetical protein [Paenibacillus sp. Leaf72]KQO18673.1 hypothetical protein ASF12_08800 [Paenibacillus sp. Leaf72]
MNVGELIERVRLEIFNDLTDAEIVGRFNELSRRLFRSFPLPNKEHIFVTTAVNGYVLPADCPEDRIQMITVGGMSYTKISPNLQGAPNLHAKMIGGKLYLEPNPIQSEVVLLYRQRPPALSAGHLTDTPGLPEDYHGLYIYDAAAWIAGLQKDVDMLNNFRAEFLSLLQDAQRDIKTMGIRRVKETTLW